MSVEQALETFAATANRIADERNKFKAQRDVLLAAAIDIWKLFEEGALIRSDHEPVNQVRERDRALSALRYAIADSEEK